jgi:hypothetical protein
LNENYCALVVTEVQEIVSKSLPLPTLVGISFRGHSTKMKGFHASFLVTLLHAEERATPRQYPIFRKIACERLSSLLQITSLHGLSAGPRGQWSSGAGIGNGPSFCTNLSNRKAEYQFFHRIIQIMNK